METFLWSRDCCLWTSIDFYSVRVRKLPSVDVRVCLATDSFWLEDWVSIGKLREKHMCLEASWLQEWEFVPEERRGWVRTCVWRFTDCKNVSSCWEITGRDPVEGFLWGTSLSVDVRLVFGEWLTGFHCSVLKWKWTFFVNRTPVTLQYLLKNA
jgi:hypothetical protein